MRVLVVAPMLKEFHCAREVLKARELDFSSPFRLAVSESRKRTVHILQCGFEPDRAMELFLGSRKLPDLIIDSGSCGALAADLNIGDIISGKNAVREDDAEPLSLDIEHSAEGRIVLQVERPVEDVNRKLEYAEKGDVCTMESYNIAAKGLQLNLPVVTFRCVTDMADKRMNHDFKANIRTVCMDLYRYIADYLENRSN